MKYERQEVASMDHMHLSAYKTDLNSFSLCLWCCLLSGPCFVLPQAGVVFPPFTITGSETSLLICWLRCATRSRWNPSYSDPDTFSHATANSQDGARLDIVVNGFWGGRSEHCFMDVRVFNSYAQSNVHSISAAYRRHENIKRRAYGQRVREIEHASFTPIVMSATGV